MPMNNLQLKSDETNIMYRITDLHRSLSRRQSIFFPLILWLIHIHFDTTFDHGHPLYLMRKPKRAFFFFISHAFCRLPQHLHTLASSAGCSYRRLKTFKLSLSAALSTRGNYTWWRTHFSFNRLMYFVKYTMAHTSSRWGNTKSIGLGKEAKF